MSQSLAKVAVTSVSFSKNLQLRDELKLNFPNSHFNESGSSLDGSDLIQFIADAELVIAGTEKFDAEVVNSLKTIRMISKYGVGLDNIDQDFAKKKGIQIGWRGGVNKTSVAEQVMCFLIGQARNLFSSSYQLKRGEWVKNGGSLLSGKRIGIVGFGNIGEEVARMLAPFNCKICVTDILDKTKEANDHGAEFTKNFWACVEGADFVTLHVPLTESTRHLVNQRFLKRMKSSAFLVNTSRGGVVNQDDLLAALNSSEIAGAAIDVYENEPFTDGHYLKSDRLICTPHIGGNAAEAVLAMGRSAIENLKIFEGIE